MITRIPSQSIRRWIGPYLGNYYGFLWKTFNIDLEKEEGKVSLSRRLVMAEDTLDTTDTGTLGLGRVTAFLRTDADCTDRWWALNRNGRLFKALTDPTLPNSNWGADTGLNTPIDARDMAVFGNDSRADSGRNQLFVTRDSTIAVLNDTGANTWDPNWWTTTKGMTALKVNPAISIPHPIEYFPFRKIALVGDGNLVHTISRTSDTTDETTTYARLTLPLYYLIQHIFYTSDRAWILCSHLYGGEGAIVEWDGFSQTYNKIYGAHGTFPLSGVDYNGVPIIINSRGLIMEYNGAGFVPMVRNAQKISFPMIERTSINLTDGIVARGMTVAEDGLIYINLKEPNQTHYRQLGGIWCLNPITGRLYNKYSIGQWGSTDYGNQAINAPGAIYAISGQSTSREFLIGGLFWKNYNPITANSAIWTLEDVDSTTANRGYFITQYIPTDNIKDFWDTIWLHFKRFATSTNRIIIKAKGIKSLVNASGNPLELTITWSSATVFSVTLATNDDALVIGDEVEVLSGDNAGILAHITDISGVHGATQTITIDESGVTSTVGSIARFDRWKKLKTISSVSIYEDFANIGISSSFIQFKIEMRGPYKEMEISDLVINHDNDINLKK